MIKSGLGPIGLSKHLAAAWDLAVETLGLPLSSFSRLFPMESLKAPLGFFKEFLGFQMSQTALPRVKKV